MLEALERNREVAGRVKTSDVKLVDLSDKATVSKIMREMGRRGGIKGAATLNGRLTPEQRSASARRAAKARWRKQRALK